MQRTTPLLVLVAALAAAAPARAERQSALLVAPQLMPSARSRGACALTTTLSALGDALGYGFFVGCQHGRGRLALLWDAGLSPGHFDGLEVLRFGLAGQAGVGLTVRLAGGRRAAVALAAKALLDGGVFEGGLWRGHVAASAGLQLDLLLLSRLFDRLDLALQLFAEVLPVAYGRSELAAGEQPPASVELGLLRLGGSMAIRWGRSRSSLLLTASLLLHSAEGASSRVMGWMLGVGLSCCSQGAK